MDDYTKIVIPFKEYEELNAIKKKFEENDRGTFSIESYKLNYMGHEYIHLKVFNTNETFDKIEKMYKETKAELDILSRKAYDLEKELHFLKAANSLLIQEQKKWWQFWK